jgi:hypothetical protein
MLRTATDSLDAALDAALAMTFPASDPVALFRPDSAPEPLLPREPILNSARRKIPLANRSAHRAKRGEPFGVSRMK